MKSKHVLIVLVFIALWFFIRNYRSITQGFQKSSVKANGALINGKKQGEWKAYYLDGKLKLLENYKNDTLNGPKLSYSDNGNLSFRGKYAMGILVDSAFRYYYNGKLKSMTYNEKSGKGVFKIYHNNGTLGQTGKLKNGSLDDTCKTYFETGTLKAIEIYKDKKKAGQWRYYAATGKLLKTELYRNDSLVNFKK